MPKRPPILATMIKDEIREKSSLEVARLNELLDGYIAVIDENNAKFEAYYQDIIAVQNAIEDAKVAWEKIKKARAKAKKARAAAKKAKATAENSDKANTITMSLNPVAAALQFAAKFLKTELDFEIDALSSIVEIVEPAKDAFIGFAGGKLSSGLNVKGTMNEKIEALLERIKQRKLLRQKKIARLAKRISARTGLPANPALEGGKTEQVLTPTATELTNQEVTPETAQAAAEAVFDEGDYHESDSGMVSGLTDLQIDTGMTSDSTNQSITQYLDPDGPEYNSAINSLVPSGLDNVITVDELFDGLDYDYAAEYDAGNITLEEFNAWLDS